MLPISKHHDFIWAFLHLALYKPQQVLLVHARRVVDVRVDLSNVVEVSMRHAFAVRHLLVFVQEHIQIELAFEILQATECKTLRRSIRRDI